MCFVSFVRSCVCCVRLCEFVRVFCAFVFVCVDVLVCVCVPLCVCCVRLCVFVCACVRLCAFVRVFCARVFCAFVLVCAGVRVCVCVRLCLFVRVFCAFVSACNSNIISATVLSAFCLFGCCVAAVDDPLCIVFVPADHNHVSLASWACAAIALVGVSATSALFTKGLKVVVKFTMAPSSYTMVF